MHAIMAMQRMHLIRLRLDKAPNQFCSQQVVGCHAAVVKQALLHATTYDQNAA